MNESTYLALKWSTSRGRDTYGYNIITLTDTSTGKRYRAMGGGYDMKGTVFGEWLQDVYGDELVRVGVASRAGSKLYRETSESEYVRTYPYREDETSASALYGMTYHDDPSSIPEDAAKGFRRVWVTLDGASGFNSMRAIAEAIGFDVLARDQDRNGNARGYLVTREI